MGCNCKGTNKEQITVSKTGVIQDKKFNPINPPTIEEVTRAKDYLKARVKTEQERQFFYDFIYNNFGEKLGPYCDHICYERQTKRLIELQNQILIH